MKTEINLLPQPLQLRRRRRIYLIRLGHMQRHVIGVLLTGLAVVVGAYLVADRTKRLTVDAVQHNDSEYTAFVHELTKINTQLVAVRQWRDEHEPWIVQVETALQALPPDVRVREIQVEEHEASLELRGVFTSREALTLFQRRLEGLPWVTDVKAPLSNFATSERTQFSLTLLRQGDTP